MIDEFDLEDEVVFDSETKKKRPILVFCLIVIGFVVILVDLQLFEYRWRPEAFTKLLIYGWIGHVAAIVSTIYLIYYTAKHVSDKVSKVISIVILIICTLTIAGFMFGITLMASMKPEITLRPEGYNHVYYLYPQSRLFARKGYGVYIPDSDYTMVYYEGYSAMDYDTSYVLDGKFYIKFDGKSRLFRPEENHLFEFDLSEPQY